MMGIYFAVIFFIVFIVVSQLLTPQEYDWKVNTISELAAQNYKNKKVMQTGFIGFGILLCGSMIFNMVFKEQALLKSLPIFIYALSVGLSGIFCTQPFIKNVQYLRTEARNHSFLAQLAGFSFVAAILICMFESTEIKFKILHGIAFVFVMGCSILFGKVPRYRGVFQRIMYLGSFIWLLFLYPIL
ncbi:MAG TPA: DUF998 domain-containing protein [Ruminiclostridium sp.]